jgi:hypothetical protein
VKILKSGKTKEPKTHTTVCVCGCMYVFEAADGKYVYDQRDGDAYVVNCPECNREKWINANLLR